MTNLLVIRNSSFSIIQNTYTCSPVYICYSLMAVIYSKDSFRQRNEKTQDIEEIYKLGWPMNFQQFLEKFRHGSWPIFHTSSYLENIRYVIGICFVIAIAIYNTCQYVDIYMQWGQWEYVSENFTVSFIFTIFLFKAFVFYTRREEILLIAEKMDRHVEKLSLENDERKLKYFLNCQRRSQAIGKFFWNTTFGTIFVMYAWPVSIIFRKGDYSLRPLGVRTYLPFSLNATDNYIVAYVGEIILGSVMTMHTIAFDTFFVGCILFAIARLRSLQLSIETVGLVMMKKLRVENGVSPWEHKNFREKFCLFLRAELKKCVEEHQEILALCKIIDSMLSLILFVVFFIYAGIICLVGFNAMLLGPGWNLLKLGQYLGALLIQISLYYWHGNELMTESLKVADSAVRCDWYDFGESNIKTIVFIIFRSQKPILLTAGKFYKVTLETFLSLLSSSYSYFAILKQFYE